LNAGGLRFLLLLDDGISDAPIRAALPASASVQVTTLDEAVRVSGRSQRPDLALIACATHSDRALAAIEALSAVCTTVALYLGTPNGFMEEAFAMGAEDLVVLPQPPEDLAFALEKVIARRHGSAMGSGEGAMIAVLGPKGGTGKTLTACNLAVALAHAGRRSVIVDLDLQFGDVGLALGLRPEHTVFDLAVAGGSLDAGKLDSFLVAHESGARALLAPTRPDQAAAVGIDFLRDVFGILRARHDYLIVDTPPAFSAEVIAAIDAASHRCVVGMLDALSLKDTKLGLETLEQMGYAPEQTTLVLNRADSSVGITQSDVAKLLGRTPDILIPSDRGIPRALTGGRVIIDAEPKSGAARAFTTLASLYLEDGAGSSPAPRDHHDRQARRPLRVALARRS
jgi:pilus assembly protein CpaE